MKLLKIKIFDFRSILNQEISLDYNCIGLIGLNESGKSNVLTALRLLDNTYQPTFNDRSKISRKYPKIECLFTLDESDFDMIQSIRHEYLNEMSYSSNFDLTVTPPLTVSKTIQVEQTGGSLKRVISYNIPLEVSTNGIILKLKDPENTPPEAEIQLAHEVVPLTELGLIDKEMVPEEHLPLYQVHDNNSIKWDFQLKIQEHFESLSPKVIYWTYSDKFLLPSEIQYDTFLEDNNPYNNSAPLYNIFLLSQALRIKTVEDLSQKIALWINDSSERRKDGAIITQAINKYIKQIWSDYDQELKIELEETKITIHINDPNSQEMNFYSMEARSQGFKTFISFILTIAAEAENGLINNFILLLDEPETHLHPSGVRYMKEELLKLSKSTNYIFFSTHSIFMIDRSNLKRHIIVEKRNEITVLTPVKRNNFIQEAVIYESMGTQLDEFSIPNKNIVVEGELDLELFTFYKSLFSETELKPNVVDAQIWDGGGTSKIEKFFESKMLPPGSNWQIIFDNDNPGQSTSKKLKKMFEKSPNVKLTTHFYSDTPNYELEDILPRNIIEESFNKSISVLSSDVSHAPNYSTSPLEPFSKTTESFVAKNALSKDQRTMLEKEFKETLYNAVCAILIDLEKEQDLDARRLAFIQAFPQYHDSACKIILKQTAKADTALPAAK